MVSIEQIQKANNLSKELKKHGFANDFNDAYNQAEQIYDKAMEDPQVNPAEVVVVEKSSNNDTDELLQRIHVLERHKAFAQQREEAYKNQISQLTEKVNELVKSIKLIEMNQVSFKKKLRDMKSTPKDSKSTEIKNQEPKSVPETPIVNAKPSAEVEDVKLLPDELALENLFNFNK